MLESKVSVWKEKKSYVSSAQRWWSKESEEMRGVVYAMSNYVRNFDVKNY